VLEKWCILEPERRADAVPIRRGEELARNGELTIDEFFGGAGRMFAAPPTDAATRLKWPALQAPGFHQPFKQLAKVLAQRGDDAGARQVLIALEDARYATAGPLERLYGKFLKATIGYGLRPLLTIFWSFAVVTLDWPVVSIDKQAGVMRPTWPETRPVRPRNRTSRCTLFYTRSMCSCPSSTCIRNDTGGLMYEFARRRYYSVARLNDAAH